MNRFALVPALASVLVALVGCSDDPTPATAANATLAEKYRKLGDNLGTTVALLKSSATTPGPVTPADLATVARMPLALTGGVDTGAEQKGKTGEKAANIDGVPGDETVTTFVPDAPTGTGTSATLPSFAAWKGSAASDDAGTCYLAWTKGASWFVASKCGDTTSAWVCQVTSAETVCNACNAAGACAPCDMTQSRFTCAAP